MKNVLIISGPTGSGESTITKEIIRRFPAFRRLVTATSRAPRLREQNRLDYYFFSKAAFEEKIKSGEIIEYTYIKNRDVYYGTYKPDLEAKINQGYNVIANTDIVGTKFYKRRYGATAIFIKSDLEDIRQRLKMRQPDISLTELGQRVENAAKEIAEEEVFYDYIVYNRQGQLETAIDQVVQILKQAGYSFFK